MNKRIKKVLLPAGVMLVTVAGMYLIFNNPPKAQRAMAKSKAVISVETRLLTPQPFMVSIDSYGTVKPRTQSNLVAQVSGQITEISDTFREGGFFERGEVLLKLDDRDLRANVKQAQASLMNAKQALLEEKARVRQAQIDWQRLGGDEQPGDLVLRKPQLAAAQAQVMSAQAQLEKAELDLERTQILAPYGGRVLTKSVDVGQVVSTNTVLAEVYATDYVEVRLPIKNKDLALINLPRQLPGDTAVEDGAGVVFSSDLVGEQSWQGRLVRTESAIDTQAQQLYAIAQIDEPYHKANDNQYPIKIGQYVTAKISGKTLENAIIIPNGTIYQGTYVYTVQGDILQRKDVTLAWQNQHQAMVKSGLNAGDELVLTPLGQVSSGTQVKVLEKSQQGRPAGRENAL